MKKRLRKTVFIIALLTGIVSCGTAIVLYQTNVTSYYACSDGWISPSIGKQGACSHHGGVVTKYLDKRTSLQKDLTIGLGISGLVSLIGAALLGRAIAFPSVDIDGEWAMVPLTIASETRSVEVVWIDEKTYITVDDVALVRCPNKMRKTVYRKPIEFVGKNGKYKQNLIVWIDTGRGRAKGYYGKAFAWNNDI